MRPQRTARAGRPSRSQKIHGAGGSLAGFKSLETYTSSASTGTIDFSAQNPAAGDLCVIITKGGNGVAGAWAITGYTRVTSINTAGGVHHKILGEGETTAAWTGGGLPSAAAVFLISGYSYTSGAWNQCNTLGGSATSTAQSVGSRTASVGSFLLVSVFGSSGSVISTGSFSPTPLATDEAGLAGAANITSASAVYEGTGAGINAIHTHASTWSFASLAARHGGYAIIDPA